MSRPQAPLKKLESENLDNSKELAISFYHDLVAQISMQGGIAVASVNELLHLLPTRSFIVRRDDPIRVIRLVSGESNVSLHRDPRLGDKPYANAIEWQTSQRQQGLEQAFLEGHGHFEGLVTVAGFRPTENLEVKKLVQLKTSITDIDRSCGVAVQGELSSKDLAFLIVRVPMSRFDTDDMIPDELDRLDEWQTTKQRSPQFIYRAFLFPDRAEQKLAA